MKIDRALTIAQTKLIKRVEDKGLYENFGQKEVMELEDKYIDTSSYTDEMNTNRRLIQLFEEWCINYTVPYHTYTQAELVSYEDNGDF